MRGTRLTFTFLVVASLLFAPAAIGDEHPIRTVSVRIAGVSGLEVQEYPSSFGVTLHVASVNGDEEPPEFCMNNQVWLLCSDGTALGEKNKPSRIGVSNAGTTTIVMIFSFKKPTKSEVVGIALKDPKGKFFCAGLNELRDGK
jgi:hypothetical protein